MRLTTSRASELRLKPRRRSVRDSTLDDLFARGFEAVYLATGLQQPAVPDVRGAELEGVTTWKNLLDQLSAYKLGERDEPLVARNVIIIGGGSVAMDVACAVHELGAQDVDIVCLESPREMPAYGDELEEVMESGARFHTRSMPLEITGQKGKVDRFAGRAHALAGAGEVCAVERGTDYGDGVLASRRDGRVCDRRPPGQGIGESAARGRVRRRRQDQRGSPRLVPPLAQAYMPVVMWPPKEA